jgi:hypothetical protein
MATPLALLGHAAHWLSRRFLKACVALSYPIGQRRLRSGRLRTLWGVTPIVTLPLKVRCDQALGFRSESVVFTTYYITRAFTWNLRLLSRAFNIWPTATQAGYRLLLGLALLRYDVFHLFADRGIMLPVARFGINPEELSAIVAAGKRLYIYAYGADVRTRLATEGLGRWNFCAVCDDPGRYCVCDDATGRDLMALAAAKATALVSLGDMLIYMPGARHLAYWPIDTNARAAAIIAGDSPGPLRVAHAPNHAHFKGTSYLEDAIARLKSQGYAIELTRVSGLPNTDVLRLFASADVIADQFIGGACGYTALEGLALGKPVITYVRSPDLVLAAEDCPFFSVTPEHLENALLWCLTNRAKLAAIGRQGRAYVERHHDIAAVAARFSTLYRETAGFPSNVDSHLEAFEREEAVRQAAIVLTDDWHHPWQVTAVATQA